jgi:hypothetical protein
MFSSFCHRFSLGLGWPWRLVLRGRTQLDLADVGAKAERGVGLGQVAALAADGNEDGRLGVATERVLQHVRQLRIAVPAQQQSKKKEKRKRKKIGRKKEKKKKEKTRGMAREVR